MTFEPKFSPSISAKILTDLANGMTKAAVARKYECSRGAIYRLVKRVREERPARKLKPCGTVAAYKRHMRKGEDPDQACRVANTNYEYERDKNK